MKSRSPFFTVIIPTFNRASVLPRAIESVLTQTFQDFELIVIDDGSNDETASVLSNYSDRIKFMKTQNRGVSAARNLGVAKTEGKFLAFLDSDDEWLPKKLEVQKKCLDENKTSKIIHSDEIWIRNGKRVNQMKKHRKQGGAFFERALQLCLISPSAVVIERDFYLKHKGFDESFEVCEDYDLWLRMKSDPLVGEVLYHNEPLIRKYGGHDDQLSRKYYAMDLWRVRSMYRLALKGELRPNHLEVLLSTLIKKCEILIMGLKKHKNFEHLERIEKIQRYSLDLYEESFA